MNDLVNAQPDVVPTASLIGEPTRAAMLTALLDGRALTATELAARAGVTPPTASAHLAKLVAGGLLALEAQGRHRFFRIASSDVAGVLEALAGLSQPASSEHTLEAPLPSGIGFARTCYDHLAGWLGVALRDALLAQEVLCEVGAEHVVTPHGGRWFAAFGVDLHPARRGRRPFALRCLDWTERRPHLAGALGAALLAHLIERGWLIRQPSERTLTLTPAGRDGFARELHLPL
jgi:DNA-binding transcriptional ArsR family regulator